MQNTIHLLFAINQNFTGLLCNCLKSIFRNGGAERYEIYILHSDLNESAEDYIKQSVGDKGICTFIRIDDTVFEGFPETGRYPKQIYYRMIAPLYLPAELDRILYLDVDLVVINSLLELYNMDFDGSYYIACSHTKSALTKVNQFRLGVEKDVPYINTGVLLMNLQLLRNQISIERLRQVTKKFEKKLILPDQDLLTILHGSNIKLIDTMRYNLSDRDLLTHNANLSNEYLDLDWVRENAVIIHYYGKNKPWKEKYHGILDVFYRENL